MHRTSFALFSLAILALLGINAAYSMGSVNSLLLSYNVSNSIIGSLSPQNITYLSDNYVALYSGTTPTFLVNVSSSPYSIVLNATSAFNIIKPSVLSTSLSSANWPSFLGQIKNYEASSAGPLSDCLNETGLSRGATCTAANYCQSCQLIPSCNKAMYQLGGPTGVFGAGIGTFATQYAVLNNSFNRIISALSGITSSTQSSVLSSISVDFTNVSTISGTLYQNPVFPPLANVSASQLSACSSYLGAGQTSLSQNASAPGAPWYCNAVGFCQFLSYNYTLLHVMQAKISYLEALPLSDQQVMTVVQNMSDVEAAYVTPILTKQRGAVLANTINSSGLSSYPTVVNNTKALLVHIHNATLSSKLTILQGAYTNLTTKFITGNIVLLSSKTVSAMSSLQGTYSLINATYSSLVSRAHNSTGFLIKAQLDSHSQSPTLASVAYAQLANNENVNGTISNITILSRQVNATLKSSTQLYQQSVPLLSLSELTRSADSAFVSAVAPLLSTTYSGGVAFAPIYATILSLIVGIVIIAIVLLFRHNLSHKRKLLINSHTRRVWRNLIIAVFVLVLLYLAATYVYASSANTFAPATAFAGAVKGAGSVAVFVNGTATTNQIMCQSQIAQAVKAMGKKAISGSISNGACNVNGTTKFLDACLGSYAKSGTPVIILSNGPGQSIGIYSFYGTVLSATGNDAFMKSCYPALLLR